MHTHTRWLSIVVFGLLCAPTACGSGDNSSRDGGSPPGDATVADLVADSDRGRRPDVGSVAADRGGPGPSGNLRWVTREFTCPASGSSRTRRVATVDRAFVANTFVCRDPAGSWKLNPPHGMSILVEPTTGALTVPCGSGNALRPGSVARFAFGYTQKPAGARLRWTLREFTCPAGGSRTHEVAKGADLSFAAATLNYGNALAGWVLNPPHGMFTRIEQSGGRLMVPCGTGNSVRAGNRVKVALGDTGSPDTATVVVVRGGLQQKRAGVHAST